MACTRRAHAAPYLDISVTTLGGLVPRGDLIAVKLGGSTSYAKSDVDALIERLPRAVR